MLPSLYLDNLTTTENRPMNNMMDRPDISELLFIDEDADKIGLTDLGREYMSQFSDFELEINISVCRGLRLKDKLDPSVLTPEELDMADLAVMSAIELSERGVDLDARFPDIN